MKYEISKAYEATARYIADTYPVTLQDAITMIKARLSGIDARIKSKKSVSIRYDWISENLFNDERPRRDWQFKHLQFAIAALFTELEFCDTLEQKQRALARHSDPRHNRIYNFPDCNFERSIVIALAVCISQEPDIAEKLSYVQCFYDCNNELIFYPSGKYFNHTEYLYDLPSPKKPERRTDKPKSETMKAGMKL